MNFIKLALIGVIMGILLMTVVSIQKHDTFTTIWSIGLLLLVAFIAMKQLPEKNRLDFHYIMEKYQEMLEEKYQVSLHSNKEVWHLSENDDKYVAVLKDVDGAGTTRYFPFECNMYKLEFGRGTGSVKYKIVEAEYFISESKRTPGLNWMAIRALESKFDQAMKTSQIKKEEKTNTLLGGGGEQT